MSRKQNKKIAKIGKRWQIFKKQFTFNKTNKIKNKKNNPLAKLFNWIKLFQKYFTLGEVTSNSIVLAYYFVFSLAPIMIILGNILSNILSKMQFKISTFIAYLQQIIPSGLGIESTIRDFLTNSNKSLFSLGIITAIWSASGIVSTLRRCLNKIYSYNKQPNGITNRLTSFFLILGAIVSLIFISLLIFFGRSLIDFFNINNIISIPWISNIFHQKYIIIFIILFIICFLIYFIVPYKRPKARYCLIGSIFTPIIWLFFTNFFQLYLHLFGNRYQSYQLIGSVIILMLWFNISSLILLIGAVLNSTTESYFKKYKSSQNKTT